MRLTYIEFETWLTKFIALKDEMNVWESSMPRGMDCLFDNTYSNCMGNQIDITMKVLLAEDAEDVFWYIWECHGCPRIMRVKGQEPNTVIEGREYHISTLQSYLDYAYIELNFMAGD